MYSVDLSPETVQDNIQKETRTINFALRPSAEPEILTA
jgi:hypothetical protein